MSIHPSYNDAEGGFSMLDPVRLAGFGPLPRPPPLHLDPNACAWISWLVLDPSMTVEYFRAAVSPIAPIIAELILEKANILRRNGFSPKSRQVEVPEESPYWQMILKNPDDDLWESIVKGREARREAYLRDAVQAAVRRSGDFAKLSVEAMASYYAKGVEPALWAAITSSTPVATVLAAEA